MFLCRHAATAQVLIHPAAVAEAAAVLLTATQVIRTAAEVPRAAIPVIHQAVHTTVPIEAVRAAAVTAPIVRPHIVPLRIQHRQPAVCPSGDATDSRQVIRAVHPVIRHR